MSASFPFDAEMTYRTEAVAVILGVSRKTLRNVACLHRHRMPPPSYRANRRFWTLEDLRVLRSLFPMQRRWGHRRWEHGT